MNMFLKHAKSRRWGEIVKLAIKPAVFTVLCSTTLAAPVIEIYDTKILPGYVDGIKKTKDILDEEIPMEDHVNAMLRGTLALCIYRKEIKARGIEPDPKYVERRIQENKTSMTEWEYERLKAEAQLVYELVKEYRNSEKDIDTFLSETWKRRSEELSKIGLTPDLLRTELKFYALDESFQMLESQAQSFPAREKFISQVNEPSSNTLRTFRELSQIDKLKEQIVGEVGLTEEEIEKGKDYYEENKERLQSLYFLGQDDFESILLEFKREYILDPWVSKRIEEDARFFDKDLQESFLEWQRREYPRHREVFGPFGEGKP